MKIRPVVFLLTLIVLALFLSGCGRPAEALQDSQTTMAVAVGQTAGVEAGQATKPAPTLMSTLEPGGLPGQLRRAFIIEQAGAFNGHAVRRVTGWAYGFRRDACGGYRWMDSTHLLLYPLVGQDQPTGSGPVDRTRPVVIDLESGASWLPDFETIWDCDVPRWSPQIGRLIVSVGGVVSTYTPDGGRKVDYKGILRGVSPGGTKVLAEDRNWMWIDLVSGKVVFFTIELDPGLYRFSKPIWSKNEMRVYGCCYYYGNARSGQSFGFSPAGLPGEGRDLPVAYTHLHGQWVLDDTYLLVQWRDPVTEGSPGFVPLFDPATRAYYDLAALAGLPGEQDGGPSCSDSSAPPGGRYAWVVCGPDGFLIDLVTFAPRRFPGGFQELLWSPDGQFALAGRYDNALHAVRWQVLAVESGDLRDLPDGPLVGASAWHPAGDGLAYLSEDGRALVLLRMQDFAADRIALPSVFTGIVWSPSGDRLALAAGDGSLWQVDSAGLQGLDQLSPPMPDVRDVRWSADGDSLAWVGGSSLYIVATGSGQ